jgi:hypothetical protein
MVACSQTRDFGYAGIVSEGAPVLERACRTRVVNEEEERGRLQVFLPHQDLCVSVVHGYLSLAMARRWIDVLDRQFRWGARFDTFHDWDAMDGYDSSARQALTSWVVGSLGNIRSAHFLVRDRIVRMGVASANVATSFAGLRMHIHSDRERFEGELARQLGARGKTEELAQLRAVVSTSRRTK